MIALRRACAAGLIAAALAWAMPSGAQTPPPAASPELGVFAAKELAARHYDVALKAATERLRADRRDGRAAYVRAIALTRLGRGPEAVRAFEAYAKAGGKQPQLDREWGYALLAAKRPAEAQAKFEAFLRANPDRKEANLLIGRAAILAEKYDDARAALKLAYDDKALRPRALALLMNMETRRGDPIAAYWYMVELLARHPASPQAQGLDALLKATLPVSMLPETL